METEVRQLRAEEYPAQLREIPQPPPSLWARGSWPPQGTRFLVVVGSRALSPYGQEACEYLIRGLAGYPISIVSGLALGADACAHRAALSVGLHTIAVPGSGLADHSIAPRTNYGLAKDILAVGGMLLSEHAPDHEARPQDFPSRNRIMAGMADAILMIEAGERSGTLITARLASEYNRDLLCVPHRIGDPGGYGSHLFLRLGATPVSHPAHILEALGLDATQPKGPTADLHDAERAVYELLARPMTRDELQRAAPVPSAELPGILVMLELKGLAKEELGAWRRTA